jgi:hypothetical protein
VYKPIGGIYNQQPSAEPNAALLRIFRQRSAAETVRRLGIEMWTIGSFRNRRRDAAIALVLAGLLLAGCSRSSIRNAGQADGPAAVYLLKEEPAGARGVLDIRTELEGREKPEESDRVVLVARVGGVEGFTWDPNRAAFTVQDLSAAEHAKPEQTPQHDAQACPFCRAEKKKQLASTALVQVVDAEGQVPAVDARKLLGLEEGQTIVVRGAAQIDGLGNLAVRATGVYVRPESSGHAGGAGS